jgi:hypothetical protein
MEVRPNQTWARNPERGISLFMVAASLLVLLGISALAIDLGSLYVGRSEAQRAADAAALAGAKKFVDSRFLSGGVTQTTAEALARQEAIAVGGENLVGGQAAQIQPGDVTFDFSNPANPRITVTVQRVAARGNPMPTFFAKALGFGQVDVAAAATAEAYAGVGGPPIGTGCVKPWILPNCDPTHVDPTNLICAGQANFVDPSSGAILNLGPAPTGVIGALLTLKPGLPSAAPAPGQFYPIQIPPGDEPALCPECAGAAGGSEGPGGALYRHNISCCNTNQFVCGQQVAVDEQTGNMVGPTSQGVQCLIHQDSPSCAGDPSNCGQDYYLDPTDPTTLMGGSNNPNPALVSESMSTSDSIVTVPLYDGAPLSPGESGPSPTVTIIGFLQVFVRKVGPPQATVDAYVLNVAGCGSGGSGGPGGGGPGGGGSGSGPGGSISTPGGGLYPVRLVRPGS